MGKPLHRKPVSPLSGFRHDVARRLGTGNSTTAGDGAGNESGEDHRKRGGVLAPLLKFHEPPPSKGDGFSDFVGSLVGAPIERKGDAGAHFDLRDEGEKGGVQISGVP